MDGRCPPVTSQKNLLSGMIGLAMFALPANVLAGHPDRDDHPQPFAWYKEAWHQRSFKHHGPYVLRPIEDEDDDGEHCHLMPRYPALAFLCDKDGDDCEPTNQGDDDDDYGSPLSYHRSEPPVGYGLIRQRNWFIQRR
jgi:hypothetical protein